MDEKARGRVMDAEMSGCWDRCLAEMRKKGMDTRTDDWRV